QEVAATALLAPDGSYLIDPRADAYANPIRFQPALGQATLAIPSSPATLLVPGAYTMTVSSLRPPYTTSDVGTATPRVTAVLKLDTSVLLDLHFYFLDFDEFPCS